MRKVLLFTLFVLSLFSQNNKGSISGIVRDINTLEPLPGANIVIIGTKMGAATDIDGNFIIGNVPIGNYNVQISMVGYKTIIENRVLVKSGKTTSIKIRLSEDVSTTDVIIVRPSCFQDTKDAVVSKMKMDYEEIEKQPCGSFDIQRAINVHPAVVISSDTENEVIVRGGNSNENLICLDGFEVNNPNHFSYPGSGNGYISAINTGMVETVDLYAGAFPAKYGDKASSVMDVNLREGSRLHNSTKLDIGVGGVGGIIEGPFTDNGAFILSGHRSYLEVINDIGGYTSVPEYFNIIMKIDQDISPKLKFNLLYMLAGDEIEVNVNEEATITHGENWIYNAHNNQFTAGSSLKKIFKNGYATFSLSSSVCKWRERQYGIITYYDFTNNKVHETENTLKCDILFTFPNDHEISAGIFEKYSLLSYDCFEKEETLQYYDIVHDSYILDSNYVYGLSFVEKLTTSKYGGYVQYKKKINPRLETILGVRVDALSLTNKSYLSPRFLFKYSLSNELSLNGGIGRHYQSPSYKMLAINGNGTDLDHYFNDQIILGVEKIIGEDIRFTIEGYYKSYTDYPIRLDQVTIDPLDEIFYYVNGPGGYTRGLEFFIQKKVKKNLWGTCSYSISDSKMEDPRNMLCFDEDCEFEDYQNANDYGHSLSLVVGYQREFMNDKWYTDIGDKWWWQALSWIPGIPSDETGYSLSYKYQGGKPYTMPVYSPEIERWYRPFSTTPNSDKMPNYERLDLHLQSRLYSGKINIFTYFEVENIMDCDNVFERDYYSDGTTENIYQLGRAVLGGVIVEF